MVIITYCRVSTDEQGRTGYSLPEQQRACRQKADALHPGAEVVECHDEQSGAILDRPGIQAALTVAQARKPAVLLCLHPDRLARDLKHQLLLFDDFQRCGCQVLFVQTQFADSPEGRFFFQLTGAVAELEKAKITERTLRGKAGKLRAGGIPVHCHPFGYTLLTRAANGKTELVPHPTEAEWVRRIFAWCVHDNMGIYLIAKRLRDLGVPTKRNGSWSPSTVANMLRNPTYIGTLRLNRYDAIGLYQQRRDPSQPGPARLRHKPEAEWVEVPVPLIVDKADFDAAQVRLARNRRISQPSPHLLSGLVVCGICGANVHYIRKRGKAVLRCSRRNTSIFRQADCTLPSRLAGPLEDAVWQFVVTAAQDESAMARYLATQPTDLPDNSAELQAIESALSQRRAGQKETIHLVTLGLLTGEEAREPLTESRRAIVDLERRQRDLLAQQSAALDRQRHAADLAARLARLRDSLAALEDAPVTDRQAALRTVFGSITLYADGTWTAVPPG